MACKKRKLLSPWFQNELAVKIDLLLIIQKRVRNNNAKMPRVLNSPGAKILPVLVTKKLVEKLSCSLEKTKILSLQYLNNE